MLYCLAVKVLYVYAIVLKLCAILYKKWIYIVFVCKGKCVFMKKHYDRDIYSYGTSSTVYDVIGTGTIL